MKVPRRAPRGLWVVVLALLALWAWTGLELGAGRLARAGAALHTFGGEFWPPDFAVWQDAMGGLVETVQIAVLGTILGFVLSLPVGLLASTTLFPRSIALPARFLATATRIPPSILWAIFFVLVFGLGPLAGVAAIGLYSMGFLAKLQYEAFEGVPRDSLDALRAMGARRTQVAWHAAVPEAANALRSQALFMFEYNVRASTVVGLVGAGGIGQLLRIQLQFFQYDRVLATLLLVFAAVLAIDLVSLAIRRRFMESPLDGTRPRWRDAFLGARAPPANSLHEPRDA